MKAIFKNGLIGVLLLFLFAFVICGQNNFAQQNPDPSNDTKSVSDCIFAPANAAFLSDSFGKRRDSKHDVQCDSACSFDGDCFGNNFFRQYRQKTLLTGNFTATPIPPAAPRASPAGSKI